MKIIAHRGLLYGKDYLVENHPDQLAKALRLGFDIEVDVWLIDGNWYLGHDKPQYDLPEWLFNQDGVWFHAKNLEAFYLLSQFSVNNVFYHTHEDFVLTSHGHIWTNLNQQLTEDSICVLPEQSGQDPEGAYGICTDIPIFYDKVYNK